MFSSYNVKAGPVLKLYFFNGHFQYVQNECYGLLVDYEHTSHRNGLSTDNKKISFAEMMTDDVLTSREERCFRLWINSLGIATYVNNVFEDVRNGCVP